MVSTEELKPGQKFPTPTPGFGDRVFYESLLRQRPDSLMAQEWCLNYGILPKKEAAKLFISVTERKRKLKLGGSSAAASPPRKKKKAKLVKEEAVNPEIQASGADKVGSAVI